MGYRCVDCKWGTDEQTRTNLGAAAIHHYIDTGHSIEAETLDANSLPKEKQWPQNRNVKRHYI